MAFCTLAGAEAFEAFSRTVASSSIRMAVTDGLIELEEAEAGGLERGSSDKEDEGVMTGSLRAGCLAEAVELVETF